MKQLLSYAVSSDILNLTHKRSAWAQSFAFPGEGFACGDFTRNKKLFCRGVIDLITKTGAGAVQTAHLPAGGERL